jgi:prophage regulatory protein
MTIQLQKIIRKKDLPTYCGMQRTAIEEMIAAGQFPKPIPLNNSGRAVGWLESEVLAWQTKRIALRETTERRRPKTQRDED